MAEWQHSDVDRWTRARRDGEMRFVPGQGWLRRTRIGEQDTGPYFGERRVPRAKPKYYWTWPKDGKNGSKRGRFKDILSGKGPDIHLSISGDRTLHPDDWPHRPQWSRWPDNQEFRWWEENEDNSLPTPWWAEHGKKRYDFMTRRWVYPNHNTLSDAYWATEKSQTPYRFRDVNGNGWAGLPLAGGLYQYFPIGGLPFISETWL